MDQFNTGNLIYIFIALYAVYGMLFAPFVGAKILGKTGNSERFWFYMLILFNIYIFAWSFFSVKCRSRLSSSDKLKIFFITIGYIMLFGLVLVAT